MTKLTHLLVLLFVANLSLAQDALTQLKITNVSVIPMHINTVYENRDVTIENGTITVISKHQPDAKNEGIQVIDGTGKYLLPSYADAHVHLPEQEDLDNFFLLNLANGITRIRSMRGETWHLELPNNSFTPKLYLSTPPISRKYELTASLFDELIGRYKKQGFDFIKVLSIKDKATFDHLLNAAEKHELKLAGHCPTNIGLSKVCATRQFSSIEHLGGFFQLKNFEEITSAIDASIASGVYHCPTLDWYYTAQVKHEDLLKRKGLEYMPKSILNQWENSAKEYETKMTKVELQKKAEKSKRQFDGRLSYLGYIYRQGGKLLLSPDATGNYSIPGYSYHTEMKHYSNAGISNKDILKTSCYNMAEMFGEENEWGTIKVGCKSDLLLLNANPLDSIENSNKIEGIIFNGKYHLRSDLMLKLKESI